MKIGIFGGSFNPVHFGHLIIADRFRECLQLDSLLIVPSNISPFKFGTMQDYAPATDRIAMLQMAFATVNYAVTDTFETDRSKEISYSIDTIEYMVKKYPHDDLFFLIGEDQALNFDKWKDSQKISSLVQICVAGRYTSRHDLSVNTYAIFAKIGTAPILIDSPLIEISSSDIRQRIRNKKSINFLTPQSVINYITLHNLYT